jgi:UDP-N-acetyl-D-glucosamine dehydrogenase
VPTWEATGLSSVDDAVHAAREADLTILLQNHSSYDVEELASQARLFFDTRGVAEAETASRL